MSRVSSVINYLFGFKSIPWHNYLFCIYYYHIVSKIPLCSVINWFMFPSNQNRSLLDDFPVEHSFSVEYMIYLIVVNKRVISGPSFCSLWNDICLSNCAFWGIVYLWEVFVNVFDHRDYSWHSQCLAGTWFCVCCLPSSIYWSHLLFGRQSRTRN